MKNLVAAAVNIDLICCFVWIDLLCLFEGVGGCLVAKIGH